MSGSHLTTPPQASGAWTASESAMHSASEQVRPVSAGGSEHLRRSSAAASRAAKIDARSKKPGKSLESERNLAKRTSIPCGRSGEPAAGGAPLIDHGIATQRDRTRACEDNHGSPAGDVTACTTTHGSLVGVASQNETATAPSAGELGASGQPPWFTSRTTFSRRSLEAQSASLTRPPSAAPSRPATPAADRSRPAIGRRRDPGRARRQPGRSRRSGAQICRG